MRDIKINCKKVYDTGIIYENELEKIKQIKEKLTNISSKIKEEWTGDDNHNFLESFNAHIYDLGNLMTFLEENGKILKDTALEHSQINSSFVAQIERSEKDEYEV